MKINYAPGQILCIKSSMGPWYYISVLRRAIQTERADETYELHTCCDLSIDGDDGSKTITFARGNGTLLDVDTTFEYVREAYGAECVCLYNALVKAYKDYDLGWTNPTDSTFDDIRDWLYWEFDVDLNDEANQYTPLGETISEIQNYIWDAICKETGNYQEKTVEPEMVNKQEFIAKVRNWLENHTYDDKYWTSEGDDLYLGNLIGDICKHLEE